MKERMQNLLSAKQEQKKALDARMIEADTKEERAAIGETLAALAKEIADVEAILAEMDEPADEGATEENENEGRNIIMASMEVRNGQNEQTEIRTESKEYRSAYLKHLMGKDMSDTEARDIAAANAVIPVQTQNAIITKVRELVPLLNEVQLLNVAGNVTFAVEGTVADAALHTENAEIASAADKLVTVSLAGYEIVKLVRISATVKTMSIDAFENWLTDMLSRKVAEMIEHYIVNGTGSNQPKGIVKAATWGTTNSVAWVAAAPTAEEIIKQIGLLPSRHARVAKFLMNRTTFWTSIMPVRDDKKMPIVAGEGAGAYNVFGYPVLLSDEVPAGEVYFGNFKMIVANLADDIKVDASSASGFRYNAIDYRGTAIFDCDIADDTAFVKGGKSAS